MWNKGGGEGDGARAHRPGGSGGHAVSASSAAALWAQSPPPAGAVPRVTAGLRASAPGGGTDVPGTTGTRSRGLNVNIHTVYWCFSNGRAAPTTPGGAASTAGAPGPVPRGQVERAPATPLPGSPGPPRPRAQPVGTRALAYAVRAGRPQAGACCVRVWPPSHAGVPSAHPGPPGTPVTSPWPPSALPGTRKGPRGAFPIGLMHFIFFLSL